MHSLYRRGEKVPKVPKVPKCCTGRRPCACCGRVRFIVARDCCSGCYQSAQRYAGMTRNDLLGLEQRTETQLRRIRLARELHAATTET